MSPSFASRIGREPASSLRSYPRARGAGGGERAARFAEADKGDAALQHGRAGLDGRARVGANPNAAGCIIQVFLN